MRSLEEIEAWLISRPGVESVTLASYLLKSYPPQRDFHVACRMEDGSVSKKIVNVFDLGDQQLRFHQLRDE